MRVSTKYKKNEIKNTEKFAYQLVLKKLKI